MDTNTGRPSFIVAITGASGSVYGFSLLKAILEKSFFAYLLISDPGFKVIKDEIGMFRDVPAVADCPGGSEKFQSGVLNKKIKDEIADKFMLHEYINNFTFLEETFLEARIASGSAKYVKGMAVIPCSMGSLSRIACGNSGNLIERAADVMLKERKKLVVCPRETPLSDIHLKNMLSLASSGAVILPPMPAFYGKPQTIEDIIGFVTGKILDCLNIDNDIYARWKGYD